MTSLTGPGISLGSQILTGSGNVLGSVIANSGSTLEPGTATSGLAGSGILSISNSLTLNGGSVATFGLNASSPANSVVSVANVLTLPATGKTTINLYTPGSSAAFAASGVYALFQYNTLVNGSNLASEFVLGAGGSGFTPFFSTIAGSGGTTYLALTLTQSGVVSQWQGPTSNSFWNNSSNWTAGIPSSPGDSATFGTLGTPPTVTLNVNETVGSISFNNVAGYNISGGSTLTFDNKGAGATVSAAQGSHVISVPVLLNDNLSIQPAGGASLAFTGNITGTSTAPTLTINGAGTTILSGTDTYGPAAGTFGTTLSQGTLRVGSNTALSSGDVLVTASSTLQAGSAGLSVANNMNVASGAVLTVDSQANTLALPGVVSGAGSLNKIGSGVLTLGANNTYTGGTRLSAGTAQISSATSLGAATGNLTFGGGTLQLGATIPTTPRNFVIDTGKTAVIDTNSFSLTDTGVISGNGITTLSLADGLVINSSTPGGSLTLSAAETYTGQTQLSGGTLVVNTALALLNTTLIYSSPSANLSFGAVTTATFGGLIGTQPITLNNNSGGAVALVLGANNTVNSYTGILSGLGSLIKVGTGGETLGSGTATGATYSGTTSVNNGNLVLGGTDNLTGGIDLTGTSGTATLTIQDNAVVNTTGSILVDTGDANSGAALNQSASPAALTIGGNANVSAATFAFGNGGTGTRVNGASLTVQGTALVTITGTFNLLEELNGTTTGGNTVVCTTNLNSGTLAVGSIAVPTGGNGTQRSQINFSGGTLAALTSDGGTVFWPSSAYTTAAVNPGGLIFSNAAGLTDTIAQALVHGTGTPDGGVAKIGAGMLILSSTANTYTGPTNVSAGILVISASGSLPTGNSVTVGAAGTLVDPQFTVLATAGTININGNMIVQNSPSLQTLTNAVAAGYNGGAWNGSGAQIIGSTAAAADTNHLHALGVIQNDNGSGTQLYNTFEGYTTLNDSDVLIKYTYYGDTDLNGKVDGTDYSRIDHAFFNNNNAANTPLTGWFNGDFNYDNVINGSDYTLMDNAFNRQGAVISAQVASPTALVGGGSAVPEPTSLTLLGIGAVGLLGRRSRRQG